MKWILSVVFSLCCSSQASEWPQLLGPERSGVLSGEGLTGIMPVVLWDRPMGSGFAGPVVAEGRVILFHRVEDECVVEACNVQTGELLWEFSRPTDYIDSFGFDNGPRAVPTVGAGRVVVHGPDGKVDALSLANGEWLWERDMVADFQSPQGYFGRACSPLILEDRVILTPGGADGERGAGVVALELETGAPIWQSVADEAGYSSPMVTPAGDLLCWMRNEIWLLDPKVGEVKANVRLRASMDASVNASQPIFVGEEVWFTAGYGVGLHRFKIDGLEPVSQTGELMDCHYSTPLWIDGHLYGFHGRQETGQVLRCVDPQKETVAWESERVPGGTLIAVGRHLLVVTEEGELWVVRVTPEELDIEYRVQILRSGHRAQIAYSEGMLFARDDRQLVAVRMR